MSDENNNAGGFNLDEFEQFTQNAIAQRENEEKGGTLNCSFYTMYQRDNMVDLTIIPLMIMPGKPYRVIQNGNIFSKSNNYKGEITWKNWKVLSGKGIKQEGGEILPEHTEMISTIDNWFFELGNIFSKWGIQADAKAKIANLPSSQKDQITSLQQVYRTNWVQKQAYLKCLVVSRGQQNRTGVQQIIELKPAILMFDRLTINDLQDFFMSKIQGIKERYPNNADYNQAFMNLMSQAELGKKLNKDTEVWKLSFYTEKNDKNKDVTRVKFDVQSISEDVIRVEADGTIGELVVDEDMVTDYDTSGWFAEDYDITKYSEIYSMMEEIMNTLNSFDSMILTKEVNLEKSSNSLQSAQASESVEAVSAPTPEQEDALSAPVEKKPVEVPVPKAAAPAVEKVEAAPSPKSEAPKAEEGPDVVTPVIEGMKAVMPSVTREALLAAAIAALPNVSTAIISEKVDAVIGVTAETVSAPSSIPSSVADVLSNSAAVKAASTPEEEDDVPF